MAKVSKPRAKDVVNFYEQLPKPKDKYETNPNFDIHGLEIPFRMLAIGATGSMKTNSILDIFQKFSGTFHHLTVICRNKDEPLYNLLSDSLPKDQLTMIEIEGDDLAELPTMDGLNSDSPHTMVIFDDLCLVKKQDAICEFFIRARKVNISCAYLTQAYYQTPKVVRINCNYIMLKKIDSRNDLRMILSEYSLEVDVNQLTRLYTICTDTKLDWLLIAMQNEPGNRFFKNYTSISPDGVLNESKELEEPKEEKKNTEPTRASSPPASSRPISQFGQGKAKSITDLDPETQRKLVEKFYKKHKPN
jgi:hypothetical protein